MSDKLDINKTAGASLNSAEIAYLDFNDGGNMSHVESSDRVDVAVALGFPFVVQIDRFWETVTLYAFRDYRDARLARIKLSPDCYVSEVISIA